MKFKQYLDEMCVNFNVLMDESLESIKVEEINKNEWIWNHNGIDYRAKVVKINGIYDFMFGADREGVIVTGDTHSGQPMRAFAGAFDALRNFFRNYNPNKWEYSGFYTKERLYDLFSKRIEKEFGYKLIEKYKDDFMVYYIFNK